MSETLIDYFKMYQKYIPIVISALTVLILGMWNPVLLQKRIAGKPNGMYDPKWLALAALGTGVGSVLLLKEAKKENILNF